MLLSAHKMTTYAEPVGPDATAGNAFRRHAVMAARAGKTSQSNWDHQSDTFCRVKQHPNGRNVGTDKIISSMQYRKIHS
jgi:hypothetical protein